MQFENFSFEKLGSLKLAISKNHRFGTDAFLLADFAAPRHKDSVCDLCSGCGIVAAVMYERFAPKAVETVEIAEEGCELFKLSVKENDMKNVHVTNADLKDWKAEKELDLITCNPPYFADGAGMKNDCTSAVNARHEVLCSIFDICKTAARSLKYGARLCICNRPERLCDIIEAMRSSGIEPKRIRFVAKNPDSAPWLVLVEGKKGASAFMTVEKNFYTCDEDAMKGIYCYDKK